jgi:hypothetical protein
MCKAGVTSSQRSPGFGFIASAYIRARSPGNDEASAKSSRQSLGLVSKPTAPYGGGSEERIVRCESRRNAVQR